jgi:cbb3-type cytochrome oxidase subunit 3
MSGLILEALLALVILLLIVWWTMFSGRPRGEVPQAQGEIPENAQGNAQDKNPGETHGETPDLEDTQKPPPAAKSAASSDAKD